MDGEHLAPGYVAVGPDKQCAGFLNLANPLPFEIEVLRVELPYDDRSQKRKVELLGRADPRLTRKAGDQRKCAFARDIKRRNARAAAVHQPRMRYLGARPGGWLDIEMGIALPFLG